MAKNYTVVDSREIRQITMGGRTKLSYRVDIETDMGARGTVDVTPDQWNEKDLDAILTARAEELNLPFVVSKKK